MSLTDAQVSAIRTSGYTDSWWADKLCKPPKHIRFARIGRTYRHVLTPPDTAPRDGTGRRTNSDPVRAKPQRLRRKFTWD